MSGFPDPEDEFELMYGDDMDIAFELEENFPPVASPLKKSKRSLDFREVNAALPPHTQLSSPKPLEASPIVRSTTKNKGNSPRVKSPKGKSKPVALQSKELFSWQVIELKSPTDESPEGKSPKDKSLKGKSPKDKSLKGKSPKGKSPKDKSPEGKSKPVPLQSKELFRWQVIDLKSPTDESSEGKPPKGKSPKGKSPKGKSPEGKSPKGKSPKGKSPEGKSKPKALQSKELFSWQVIDLKSRTDESPEAKSPKGKSPKGKSPKGKSPTDKSPKVKLPTDKSPKGKSKPVAFQSKQPFSFEVIDLKSSEGKSPKGKSKPAPLKSKQLFSSQVIDLTPNLSSSLQSKVPTSLSHKRTIDETDFDQDFHFPEDLITKKATLFKRPKISLDELKEPVVSPEEQQRTIRKILELRRESQQKVRSGLPRGSVKILSRKENLSGLSRVFPAWPFVKAVDKDGIGVYIKVDSEEDLLEQGSSLSKQYSKGHILSEPFDSLLDAARSINQSKAKLKIKETILQQIRAEKKDTQTGKGELWVEKYRPKNYRQLLSDEGTNRTLLQWLKLWDKAVFDRDLPKHLNKYEEIRVGKGKKTEFKFKRTNVLNQDLDQNDCPVNKVVLLCGPPGLGKTTLAHIVANHAGYNVVELNASDDRSPALFHNTLEAATTMQSVMSENPKPNCLVLDEIDGAPQASIDVLVKYITGKPNTKKKAKGSTGLKRPIICICNDLYVPALRPLRQIAFVLQFPPTSSARLAGRLMEVSKKEKIKTDLSTMMALSEKTGNDIRSCLSALSCYQNQTLRLPAIHNANIGVKDMQKPLFSMWGDIFQIPDDKKVTKPGSNNSTSNNEDHLSKRCKYILRSIQSMGDYDRLAQGVFENYLNVKVHSDLHTISQGLEGFCSFDMINRHILSNQDYRLYPYLAYPFVTWHLNFAVRAWPKISYPSADYEASQRKQKCSQVIKDVLKGMSLPARIYNQSESFLLDTASLLPYMLAPPLRPISTALFSAEERARLAHLMDIMIDYNLNFVQIRQEDGAYAFVLDPNIEMVYTFAEGSKFPELSYACKQIVAHEISVVKMRRFEARMYQNSELQGSQEKNLGSSKKKKKKEKSDVTPSQVTTPKAKKALPNHLQRLAPKSVKKSKTDTIMRDFFGRVVHNTAMEKRMRTDDIVKSDIWFNFKEGYNNAVRKNILMKDLL